MGSYKIHHIFKGDGGENGFRIKRSYKFGLREFSARMRENGLGSKYLYLLFSLPPQKDSVLGDVFG